MAARQADRESHSGQPLMLSALRRNRAVRPSPAVNGPPALFRASSRLRAANGKNNKDWLPSRKPAGGILHRDLKPSNLFLNGGSVEQVKILDFGIARHFSAARAMTQTGVVMGTPEYMAPEQARGVRNLTPTADLFSLGCILYECLTGRPPFVADHLAAVLVRILLEDPPPVSARRLGVPKPLLTLLHKMLQKDPGQRPVDAAALRTALLSLEDIEEGLGSQAKSDPAAREIGSSFAEHDQRLFSVVIAAPPGSAGAHSGSSSHPAASSQGLEFHSLVAALRALDVGADALAGGALVVTVFKAGSATDQAALAARAALLIKERWPSAVVSLATGRGSMQGDIAVGEVVDRAARYLKLADAGAAAAGPVGIWLDDLSARLLDNRFSKVTQPGGVLLLSEEKEADSSRKLLGKPTPCVGRELELGILESQLSACVEESEARVVLITAPPGTGKSRLRHEFLRRVAQREDAVILLLCRGDLMTAGAPYGILGQAVRSFCAITAEMPADRAREQLAARIGRLIPEAERGRVVEFMGELCGASLAMAGSRRLLAARNDPRLMYEQIRKAFVEWLGAECSQAPLLVVLDDLQWGDSLSVGVLDAALRDLHDAPLCVLALARPEVRESFPKLWSSHHLQDLPLKPLGKKACERLVKQVLGQKLSPEMLGRIVEQSTGNALFLEETACLASYATVYHNLGLFQAPNVHQCWVWV